MNEDDGQGSMSGGKSHGNGPATRPEPPIYSFIHSQRYHETQVEKLRANADKRGKMLEDVRGVGECVIHRVLYIGDGMISHYFK